MKARKIRRKIKNAVLKTLVVLNFISLMILVCAADSITSWQPIAVMILNVCFLMLMAWANGLMDLNGEEYGNS